MAQSWGMSSLGAHVKEACVRTSSVSIRTYQLIEHKNVKASSHVWVPLQLKHLFPEGDAFGVFLKGNTNCWSHSVRLGLDRDVIQVEENENITLFWLRRAWKRNKVGGIQRSYCILSPPWVLLGTVSASLASHGSWAGTSHLGSCSISDLLTYSIECYDLDSEAWKINSSFRL